MVARGKMVAPADALCVPAAGVRESAMDCESYRVKSYGVVG